MANNYIIYPPENERKQFRGYKNRLLARNGLRYSNNESYKSNAQIHCYSNTNV